MKRLKQSKLGKSLYRVSRTSLGAPLRLLAQGLQAEVLQPRHYYRAHARHNRTQIEILQAFEQKTNRK